ncbi:MAG: outer membrane lipoprotein carrier protein LolA [Pseudomonadota bacterium]
MKTDKTAKTQSQMDRRQVLASGLAMGGTAALGAALGAVMADPAAANTQAFNEITSHFNRVKSMTGNFLQIDPRGNQVEGRFFIQRPGKVRFEYEESYPLRIISDGKGVFIHNKKLKNWKVYPLGKTPLKLLLGNQISLNSQSVKSVQEDQGLTIVELGDKAVFGNQRIKMMFDTATYDLRQWNTIDEQGGETQVLVFDVREGVKFARSVFRVPYDEVNASRG